jgi:SAM-dependent methyltransferase
MLDPQNYRANEQLAKSLIPSWRIAQIHNVDHFERVGFPVRIANVRDIGQLVDTMQENRFRQYMAELDGISKDEYELLVEVCTDAVEFQLSYLPHRTPVLPLSTLLSAFALYRKMLGANPSFDSVLEIGPGCGYLSFFLRRHKHLRNYSQIEACESFYILQNLVNLFCFGTRFDERAFLPDNVSAVEYFVNPRVDTELSPRVQIHSRSELCVHYPWWRIGEILSNKLSFDIVTSNANLLEFNWSALDDYLSVMHRALRPEGIFLVQCTGHAASGTVNQLFEKLYEKQFAPLFLVEQQTPVCLQGEHKSGLFDGLSSETREKVQFTTNNAVFVKAGHALFERYYDKQNYRFGFVSPEVAVKRMFFDRPRKRRDYGVEDFLRPTEHHYSNGASGRR